MLNGITYNSFATSYATGGMNFGAPYSGGFNSAFGFGFNGVNGFQTTSTSSSSSSYQSEIERIRREEEEAQRRASAERQAAQERELMEEMRIEGSDIFPELTAEEEEILLAYLEKVSSSKGTTFKENAISTALPAAGAVGLTATISSVNIVTTEVGNLAIKAAGSANSTVAKAAEVTFNGAAKTSSALTSTAKVVGKWAGPVLEAGMVVYEDWNDIEYTYEHGSTSDKVKQTAQTVSVAAAAAAGFAAGAAIGSVVPVAGNIVGAVVGAVCGAVGAFIGKWCARKAVGENVGARLKREQMEKEAQERAAEEQAQKMESYNVMLMDALTYAQTDEELDEATASVLAKIQGRFMQVQEAPQEQVQTPEAA